MAHEQSQHGSHRWSTERYGSAGEEDNDTAQYGRSETGSNQSDSPMEWDSRRYGHDFNREDREGGRRVYGGGEGAQSGRDQYGRDEDSNESGSQYQQRRYGQGQYGAGRDQQYRERGQSNERYGQSRYDQNQRDQGQYGRGRFEGDSPQSEYGAGGRSNMGSNRYGGSDYQSNDYGRSESRASTPYTESSGNRITGSDWRRTSGSGEWYSGNAGSIGQDYGRSSSDVYDQAYGSQQEGAQRGDSQSKRYESQGQGGQFGSQGYGQDFGTNYGQRSTGQQQGTERYQGGGYQGKSYQSGAQSSMQGQGEARGQSHRGKGPKDYQRSDERLKEIACEMLMDEPNIDASEISVSVKDGEVTLSGTVDDRRTKHDAENLIARCAGVKEVHNQLRIKGQSSNQAGQSAQQGGQNLQSSLGSATTNTGVSGSAASLGGSTYGQSSAGENNAALSSQNQGEKSSTHLAGSSGSQSGSQQQSASNKERDKDKDKKGDKRE